MHYLLLVTLTMPLDATSEEVREEAHSRLLADVSFCGEGGCFSNPVCDWFVIGGRWSGHLSETILGDSFRQAVELECPELANGVPIGDDEDESYEKLNEIWSRLGGQGDSPLSRNIDAEQGDEDDAARVDRAIYDALLKNYAGRSLCKDNEFADLDGDPVDESFIDGKWIVVVDYHN